MFSKQDILSALESILDTSLLVEVEDSNYLIDSVNHFGIGIDYPEGITIYFQEEHFHFWKTPGDDTTTYYDILERFLDFISRLMNNKIVFIYTFRGKAITRIKIVEYKNEEYVIGNNITSINPLRLLLKKQEKREVIELKQR